MPRHRIIAALIRHGDYHQLPDTPSAHQPFPLTDSGIEQSCQAAATIREALQSHGWRLCGAVDSSRLLRAWQTARIITDELADGFDAPVEVVEYAGLAERGLGSANNLSVSTIEAVVRDDPRFSDLPADWKSNSHFRLPFQGAESLLEAGERVASHLQRSMQSLAGSVDADTLKLFVGHGAAFRHAACHLGILDLAQVRKLSMYHASPVFLEYRDGEWTHIAGDWKVRGQRDRHND